MFLTAFAAKLESFATLLLPGFVRIRDNEVASDFSDGNGESSLPFAGFGVLSNPAGVARKPGKRVCFLNPAGSLPLCCHGRLTSRQAPA
jgi:hypothetical protein